MANDIQQLIKIIDSRVESKLSKTSTKFPAKVVSVLSSSQSVVKLSNDDKEITFLNKTGEVLSVGDSVFIETIDGDLTGGFISERFGIPVLAGGGEGGSMTASEILTSLKTVDGDGSGLDADLLDGQHGSYYLNRTNHNGTQSADSITDGTTNKAFTATEKNKLEGIATGANNYTHPANHSPSIILQDSNNRFVTDTEKSTWNGKANGSHTHTASDVGIVDSGNHFTATEIEGALSELFTYVSNGKALIADAITDKGVTTSASDSFNTMATNIGNISSGETPTTGQYLIRFIDYDGTILKEARTNNGGSVTPPSDPVHDGLTFQGWNYASTAYTNVTSDVDVGAMYITTDGKTKLKIRLTTASGLSPTLYLNKSNTATMTIEWGDSTSETVSVSGNFNRSHTYASTGDYTISISITSGIGTYKFGSGSTTTTVVGGSTQVYRDTLLKAYVGDNVTVINAYSFYICRSLTEISLTNYINTIGYAAFGSCNSLKGAIIPNNTTTLDNTFVSCYSITNISLPVTLTTISSNVFQYCYSLNYIIIPNTVTVIGDNAFQNTTVKAINIPSGITSIGNSTFISSSALKKIILPSTINNIGSSAFQNCYTIKYYVFLSTSPPVLSSTNAFTGIVSSTKIYVPDTSVTAYKAATNWATYANYIYPISEMVE